jgi:hypothetical protein
MLVAASWTASAQDSSALWQAWEMKDITALSDDNSGSTFALSDAITTDRDQPALQLTPGGTSAETKLAFPVSGADLQVWAVRDHLSLEVYLPESNALNPNRFFMGMAEVTNGFSWVAGVFSDHDPATLQAGWNTISYPIDPAMRKTKPNAQYTVFFSFFHEDPAKSKQSLTEPFYLGSIFLMTTPQPPSQDRFAVEVQQLLSLDDDALIDAVARKTFDFFWQEVNPANGLIKDRSTPDSASSIAAVGFGLTAIPIAIDRGWITYESGYERTLLTLKTFATGGVKGNFGFYYHFVTMNTGERMWNSEVSSIDTALFIAGAITAGEYFKGTEVETLAEQLYAQVDWAAFAPDGTLVSMGWTPETDFYDQTWDHFDENLILYMLAIGSPTHPVPAEAWAAIDRPVYAPGGYIFLPGEPLFVYQYPLAWLDLRDKEDAFANYFNNTTLACERNQQFSADGAELYTTYEGGVWGISASDGPKGYRAYGAAPNNHDGTIAPYASIACLPFTPAAAVSSMRAMLTRFGSKVWGEYGFVSAINADQDWYSKDYIGIDQGDILLMIANYQDGFVWKLFMQNVHIQKAMAAVGFVEKQSDYAVVPAFLETLR